MIFSRYIFREGGIITSNFINHTFSFLPLLNELAFSSSSSKGIFSLDREMYCLPFVTLIDELQNKRKWNITKETVQHFDFFIWPIYFLDKVKAYLRRLMVLEHEWRIDNSVCETENRCASRRTSVLNEKSTFRLS